MNGLLSVSENVQAPTLPALWQITEKHSENPQSDMLKK
jgi:hypothetical protein